MKPASNHRWFQFSLRTLFVAVTVAALFLGWIGWRLNQARQRENLLQSLGVDGARITRIPAQSSPFMLRKFGTTYIGEILLPSSKFSDADINRVRAIFPEAKIELFATFDGIQL
jgi:hypothetical protein